MSIVKSGANKESNVTQNLEKETPNAVIFRQNKPFGLKFLESNNGVGPDGNAPSDAPTYGTRATQTTRGTSADVYVD